MNNLTLKSNFFFRGLSLLARLSNEIRAAIFNFFWIFIKTIMALRSPAFSSASI